MWSVRGAVLLAALATRSRAVLIPCDALDGATTGVGACSGSSMDSSCPLTLSVACDNMYPISLFSASGIPCGSASSESCAPEQNISFPNSKFSPAALDAVSDLVAERLVRGRDNTDAGSLFDQTESEILLTSDTPLNITFLNEGACYRDVLGMATFFETSPSVPGADPRAIGFEERRELLESEMELSVVFPNIDFEFCQCARSEDFYDDFCTESLPALRRGTSMRLLPDFRTSDFRSGDPGALEFLAGTFVTFWLAPDGFDLGYQPGAVYESVAEHLIFSTPELNDPDMVLRTGGDDLRQHAFVFHGFNDVEVDAGGGTTEIFNFSDEIFFCFEDRRRFEPPINDPDSDLDFEDICFFVTAEGGSFFGVPTSTPITSPEPTPDMPCEAGLLSECGNACCAAVCGSCGGCGCAEKPGGADLCCPLAILFNGVQCVASSDVGCVVDFGLSCIDGSGCPSA